jgi:hypothetical protein
MAQLVCGPVKDFGNFEHNCRISDNEETYKGIAVLVRHATWSGFF